MSEAQEKTVKLLDSKLDAAVIKTVTTCAIVMIVAVLIHDGDHIRQASTGATPFRSRSGC